MSDEKRHGIYYAQREMRLSSRRQQVMKEQKAKTQGKVHMYREYRTGDFPDIQIPHSAIIKPLQALAKVFPY
jgi:DNA-dependent protein kinase catalytic subunit